MDASLSSLFRKIGVKSMEPKELTSGILLESVLECTDFVVNEVPNLYSAVIERLNQNYDIYIVTSYVWKENVIDASHNLKYKYEYLRHFFPFLDCNNFIFISDKSKINFDIGIDDRPKNLISCEKKILFTEFRNKKISKTTRYTCSTNQRNNQRSR